MYDEFPHKIELVKVKSSIPDGMGGFLKPNTEKIKLNAFVDTPKTFERFEAQKLENTFDRYVYLKNIKDIDVTRDRILYQNIEYYIVSDLEDQGGMGEIYRLAIKKVVGDNIAN